MVDPWGRPYYIDENDGENPGNNWACQDRIGAYRHPHRYQQEDNKFRRRVEALNFCTD